MGDARVDLRHAAGIVEPATSQLICKVLILRG